MKIAKLSYRVCIICAVALLFFTGCIESKEDKAAKFIKEFVNKSPQQFEDFKIISIVVDEARQTPLNNDYCWQKALTVVGLDKQHVSNDPYGSALVMANGFRREIQDSIKIMDETKVIGFSAVYKFSHKDHTGNEVVESVRIVLDPEMKKPIAMELLDNPEFKSAKNLFDSTG